MGKFNKKVKSKAKKELEKAQEGFNPSARDPYIGTKEKEKKTKEKETKKFLEEFLESIEEEDSLTKRFIKDLLLY